MKKSFKVGDYIILPKNKEIWSISLQENIRINREVIVKLTHGCIGHDTYFYGNICEVFGMLLYPTLYEKTNGDVGLDISDCKKYKLPKPIINFNAPMV